VTAQFQVTTVARVKARKDLQGGGLDATLATLVDSVSQEIEILLGRRLLTGSYTDALPLESRRRYVSLPAFPISAISSVKYGGSYDFSAVTAMDPASYQLLGPGGQIFLSGLTTWMDPGFLQIVYTGGMAADTASFIAAYPRIADAAENEVIARLNRTKMPDGTPQAMGTSTVYMDQLELLKDTVAACAPWRRLRL
jgi:hypothetical protein